MYKEKLEKSMLSLDISKNDTISISSRDLGESSESDNTNGKNDNFFEQSKYIDQYEANDIV